MVLFEISKKKEKYKNCADYTRVRDKVSMQTVLTALIFNINRQSLRFIVKKAIGC